MNNISRILKNRRRTVFGVTFFLYVLLATVSCVHAGEKYVTVQVGQTKQLKAGKKGKRIKWKSNKPGTLSVTVKGKIRAKKTGTAVVTAKSGKKSQKYKITVKGKTMIRISINGKVFKAEMESSSCAKVFLKMLPLSISMEDLNGNEKYRYLDQDFPSKAIKPGTLHTGDLMLYGTDCVVLFYKTFRSGYAYTRLGRILNPQGLEEALGKGTARIEVSK